MKTTVMWRGVDSSEISSLSELEDLIDKLSVEATNDIPFSIQISRDPNFASCLLITVGHDASHVEFFSHAQSPPAVSCLGPWDSDELVLCDHGGQESEMPKRYCVPIADARESVRKYYQTGQRPDNIRWNENPSQ